jgi:hypothetical protein
VIYLTLPELLHVAGQTLGVVVNVASGHLDSVDAIAAILQGATRPWK